MTDAGTPRVDLRWGDAAPPLTIGRRRQTTWAVGLVGFAIVPFIATVATNTYGDWSVFWSAGGLAGSSDLVPIATQFAWQQAHGLSPAYFPYPPAFALVFAPLAALSISLSFWLWVALMTLLTLVAGWLLAPTYRLRRLDGLFAVLAWTPVTVSLALGQNASLGLLLGVIAIAALVAEDDLLLGVATGLLLYKPMWAFPFLLLALVRGRWRALGVVAIVAAAGYLAGIAAAGGDATWPVEWARGITTYAGPDVAGNALKVISLPLLLERIGVPVVPALAAGIVVVAVSLPGLRRAGSAEAGAVACLVGLAASPHALAYDAVVAIPFLAWILGGGIMEPWRTRIVVAAYLAGPLMILSFATVAVPPAIPVVGAVFAAVGVTVLALARGALGRRRSRLVAGGVLLLVVGVVGLSTVAATSALVVLGGIALWLSGWQRSDGRGSWINWRLPARGAGRSPLA